MSFDRQEMQVDTLIQVQGIVKFLVVFGAAGHYLREAFNVCSKCFGVEIDWDQGLGYLEAAKVSV